MENSFYERFKTPAERAKATYDLAALKERAIPILDALFSGEAKNEYGVSYNTFGICIDCAMITYRHLGPLAECLKHYLYYPEYRDHVYNPLNKNFVGDK